jgi:hypothetical protein
MINKVFLQLVEVLVMPLLKWLLGKNMMDIIGLKIETKMSSSADTSVEWVKQVTDNDLIEWNKLLGNAKTTD